MIVTLLKPIIVRRQTGSWAPLIFKFLGLGLGLMMVGLLLAPPLAVAKGKYGQITLQGPLKVELNGVLKATDSLHKACAGRNEKQVDRHIRALLESLKRAANKSSLAKDQKPHLMRMLDAAKGHLELTINRSGEKRRESLKEAFNHLVQIAKVYKLDDYRIFFCPSDKVVWLQKSYKPRNPVHPEKYGSCGKLVR